MMKINSFTFVSSLFNLNIIDNKFDFYTMSMTYIMTIKLSISNSNTLS